MQAAMKELLTKKFWQDVRKTFDEGREEGTPTAGDVTVIPVDEGKPDLAPREPRASHSQTEP
jgi:hypothetical protein